MRIHLTLFIAATCLAFALPLSAGAARKSGRGDAPAGEPPPRPLKIVVAGDAPPAVREAAQRIFAGVDKIPLLRVMADGKPAVMVASGELAKATAEERAFAHLVLVGLPEDVMIKQAWLRDARPIQVGNNAGLYVFGFGNLIGDIGYVESGRNPFLHSAGIKIEPFEAETVTISGSTANGVALAADAFLKQEIVNGVVAGNWHRGETTLLDRDPIKPDNSIPEMIPASLGKWTRIGITQAGEDEYRAVLEDTGVEPSAIWRAKYYSPGVWDGGGDTQILRQFSDGLHRRSYGNSIWAACFADSSQAAMAAKKIAEAAHLKADKRGWAGKQPALASEKSSPGPITLQMREQWLIMSTVPAGD